MIVSVSEQDMRNLVVWRDALQGGQKGHDCRDTQDRCAHHHQQDDGCRGVIGAVSLPQLCRGKSVQMHVGQRQQDENRGIPRNQCPGQYRPMMRQCNTHRCTDQSGDPQLRMVEHPGISANARA